MHIALWIVQALLAFAFLAAGAMKTFTPIEELAMNMPWIHDVPALVPRLAGVSELLGGIGLILPAATRIQPKLTPLAAAGLGLVMVLAAGFHVSRGEFGALLPNGALLALCLFVVWGRLKARPIEPRGASASPATA